jgi:hypothetical protein
MTISVYPDPLQAVDNVSGEVVPIGSLKGALDVHAADVHQEMINKALHTHTGVETTLAVATSGDGSEYQITVVSVVGFVVGDFLHIENGGQEPTHSQILVITGAVFTLDRHIDLPHPIGTPVEQSILDLTTTIGTLADPVEYFVEPVAGEVWHITRMLFAMAHSSAGDLGKFGNLPALTNGVLVRVKTDGSYRTLTNWKDAGDMKVDMFDIQFDNRSGGGGDFGTSGRWTFSQSGSVLRLDGNTNDRIEVYIQDDLTGLGFFNMTTQGHLEDE